MTDKPQNLFTRDDTFFGVCQGLGEDLRIPPNLVRLAFLPLLFFAPVVAIASYLGLGVLIMAIHWLIRDRTQRALPELALPAERQEELALAA